ncbi:MAG: glycosyltransferase [Pseudomonadota bacterium]|nr:glycosyltransferase family 2 protein [Burkholderiaceae bacterium]MDQ3445190.1 glycosyltransferase [Pseudomonadota bacterium]
MQEPFVSVVTPFYNTAPYLAECIESVLAQQYGNFEFILSDNCSTDGSREIIEPYAARDSRIRYIRHDAFVNQVQNYNRALRQISPDSGYCKVVQADDWILPECLSRMVAAAEASDSVELIGAYGQIEERVHFYGLPLGAGVFSGKEVCRKFWTEGLYVFGSPTCVMYRSDRVRDRPDFYDEACPLEDADICFELLKNKDFAFVHQVLTFTRRQAESIHHELGRYDQHPLLALMTVRRHGQAHLEPHEHARLLDSTARGYHRSLGTNIVHGIGLTKGFRRFHRQGRKCCGFEPSWGPVAGYAIVAALDLLLNPKSTAESVWRRLRRRSGSAA